MMKVDLTHHRLEMYSSIDEMPVERFHKYNKMLLIDSGIGSDLSAFDQHVAKVGAYLKGGKMDQAQKELDNLRQNIYMIQGELSPSMMSFAALVKNIDGREITDISDDSLKEIADQLKDEKVRDITEIADDVKKKIDHELRTYFPSYFDNAPEKDFYDQLLIRTKLMLKQITEGHDEGRQSKIDEITVKLLTFTNPMSFAGSENAEVLHDKQFVDMCLVISQNLHVEAERMSVMKFYKALELLREQAKERKKAMKKK